MEEMFKKLAELYPRTRFIAIGYSMGANVLTNCMARLESVEIRSRIILAISICQGYSATMY
jgi:predicted alpha/beta-fold hydrolase